MCAEYWTSREGLLLLARWSGEGLQDKQIAQKMKISQNTLKKWKKQFPQIADALDKSVPSADTLIENALLQKASGYTVDVVKTYKLKHVEYADGKKSREFEELAQGVDQVHVPADLSAQIFWLKNRKPEQWKEKPETDTNDRKALQRLDAALEELKNAVEQETD